MGVRYLADTSTIIRYLNHSFQRSSINLLDKAFEKEIIISFITEIELKVWTSPEPSDLVVYLEFLSKCRVIGIDQQVINKTADLRKAYKIKIPDAIIASTAVCNNLTLITDDEKDFARIKELKQLYPNRL
jgi:hypothetical protein